VGTERDDAICVNIFTPRWLLCEMAKGVATRMCWI